MAELAQVGMRFAPDGGEPAWGMNCISVTLTLPGNTAEQPAACVQGLPLRFSLVAALEHVTEPEALCLQVRVVVGAKGGGGARFILEIRFSRLRAAPRL